MSSGQMKFDPQGIIFSQQEEIERLEAENERLWRVVEVGRKLRDEIAAYPRQVGNTPDWATYAEFLAALAKPDGAGGGT